MLILCQPGPCGPNADCYVTDHQEKCFCKYGHVGDPYQGCYSPKSNPCIPSPCGPNAECRISSDNQVLCECLPGTTGDPTSVTGCDQVECNSDDDCTLDKICVGHRCQDPCLGTCGVGATCRVELHHPICKCKEGLHGNPLLRCSPQFLEGPKNPCVPSPCGDNTICQVLENRAVCSCLPDFRGEPSSGCLPECMVNSDCPHDKSCINMKCINPCSLGPLCGANAECKVSYHTATCVCNANYFGNPFIRCTLKRKLNFFLGK